MTKKQGPQAGTVAARLAELQKLGEPDAEFARRIGLTPQNWSNLKTGKQRSVSVETLADIVRNLKLSEADLYYIVTGKSSFRSPLARAQSPCGVQVNGPSLPIAGTPLGQ